MGARSGAGIHGVDRGTNQQAAAARMCATATGEAEEEARESTHASTFALAADDEPLCILLSL
jgi:uncharacterized membrane-anchored protein